ncbi:MAG TPA: TRAP transporter large permease subunit, partial [Candidatus Ventricola gallistercoris]|nr:TRAP transporter large permease subunit [Candidatus Ventricola gallistercoris]
PVGVVLMTTCALEKLKIEAVCKELWPWIVLLFVFLIVLIAFPQLVVFVPNMLMG